MVNTTKMYEYMVYMVCMNIHIQTMLHIQINEHLS